MVTVTDYSQRSRFSWLPVEKVLIWALFIVAMYVLRHFFFVMFMTFIVSYIMRGVVERLGRVAPYGEGVWGQRIISVVCFVLLLFALYGLGTFFVPRLVDQAQELTKKMASLEKSPRAELDEILRDTVGRWLFSQKYGGPDDERYRAAFTQAQHEGLRYEEFEDFRQFALRIEEEFRESLREKEIVYPHDFDLHSHEFKAYYERRRRNDPKSIPYTIEQFTALRDALKGDANTFSQALDTVMPGQVQKDEQLGFELHERRALLDEWKKGQLAARLAQRVEEITVGSIGSVGRYLGSLVPSILLLPVELALSLLLSFFITIDMPRLKRGVRRLERSRARDVYHEIAPGLSSLGQLIGRAFQAQGVIALANAFLTLFALKILHVQNEAFLCAIVFLCSFIPVVGVVFSGIPIAVMAITQEGGGMGLALWAIAAILLVHFIETSILNPKIVGDMLHLHPVLVLAILAIGERFFGIWGLLLGVPIFVYIVRYVLQVPFEELGHSDKIVDGESAGS